MPREYLDVDPATLHLPGARNGGADAYKLQRQIAKHGTSIVGMPPIEVSRGTDGELVINNGVTRATRAAKLRPGKVVPVEVIHDLPIPVGSFPTIGEQL